MNKPLSFRKFLSVFFVSFLALVAVGSFATPATAKNEFRKTALFNLTYEPKVKPNRVFLSANAGPYLKKIKWSGWGTNKTVGRGRFISDCSSCGIKENKPMKLTLYKIRPCPKYGVMAYRKGYLKIYDKKRPNRGGSLPLPCPPR